MKQTLNAILTALGMLLTALAGAVLLIGGLWVGYYAGCPM